MGLNHDTRKDVYDQVNSITLNDIQFFHKKHVAGKILEYWCDWFKGKVDIKMLNKYGKVQILTIKDLFDLRQKNKKFSWL